MKNKFLVLILTALPVISYATSEGAGLVNEAFILANKTKALLYYKYKANLTGKIGGITMKDNTTSGSGKIDSGKMAKMTPMISMGGNMKDVWGNEIDLSLSIEPAARWFAAKVSPAGYIVMQDEHNEQLLRLKKLIKTAEGQYSIPTGEEGNIPLTELTAAQEKELAAAQRPKGLSSLEL